MADTPDLRGKTMTELQAEDAQIGNLLDCLSFDNVCVGVYTHDGRFVKTADLIANRRLIREEIKRRQDEQSGA